MHRYRWRHQDGDYHWIRDEITLIRDESGEPSQIVGVWVNIDEQKAIELELEGYKDGLEESVAELRTKNHEICKILDEKDILFKELHHRVKNNMQVISALLGLQAMKCDSVEVVEALTKGKDRIESMALVHELLYQTDDMSRVSLIDYLKELSQGLLSSHFETSKAVTVSIDGDDCLIPIEPVVPIGLIINELVTNSLKYGFKSNSIGKIDISCNINADRNLVVLYADNGVGLPETALSEQHKSLGLNLISNLAKQLDASIRFYNDDGMRFELIVAV